VRAGTFRVSIMLTAVASAMATIAVGVPGTAGAAGAATSTTIWVPTPVCASAPAGHMSCLAQKLVKKRVSTGAQRDALARGAVRPSVTGGPSGGYTPAELATAYRLNPGAATTQTVAIVDAFDDPTVLSDLNAFDAHYGIAHETSTSFRVVNQNGLAAPLPAPDAGWAAEITLDVQAVRGLCRHCKILLVEAASESNSDLAAGVDQAVAMHAKIVSNSYGGPENDPTATAADQAAYNHPGVAILASSGDDGWYGWDVFNDGTVSDNVPSVPASYNTVIGVGGTSLYLNPNSTRAAERVWNSNGPSDAIGNTIGTALGAAGSGCSTMYNAQLWQQKVAGYGTLGCGATRRSGVDIAAVADPFTGYDVFQTYNGADPSPGWETIGGTSLASPVVAAMWALAGGPGGVKYPALSLYGHFRSDSTKHTYDVTVGGTGLCDTATTTSCLLAAGGTNPNNLSPDDVDCAWSTTNTLDNSVKANRYQCYAQPGYDGVSGVGTPQGVAVFKAMNPAAVIKAPGTVTHNVSHAFSATGSRDPFPGGRITKYVWAWGDGHTTTTAGINASHNYAAKGTRSVTLTVSDNYGRSGKRTIAVDVR
jgi:hypothetical protein